MKNINIIGRLTPENIDGGILSFDFNTPIVSDLFKNNDDNFLYKDDLTTKQIEFILYLCYCNYIEQYKDIFCYLIGDSFIEKIENYERTMELIGIVKNEKGELEKAIFMDGDLNK